MNLSKKRHILLFIFACVGMLGQPLRAQNNFADHSVLASGTWLKIPVATTGVYRLTTDDIPQLNGASCARIALYGHPGGMLSVHNRDSHPDDLTATAIEIIDNNANGLFETGDIILFYGEGPHVWRYNESDQGHFEYNTHAYANYNYYYVTPSYPDGETLPASFRIQTSQPAAPTLADITTYTGVALLNEDRVNTHGSGQIWVDDKFTMASPTHSHTLTFPSNILNGSVNARYALANVASRQSTFTFRMGETTERHTFYVTNNYLTFRNTFTGVTGNSATATIEFSPNDNNAAGYLDYIELNALLPMEYAGGQMPIRNSQLSEDHASARFVFTQANSTPLVWDVSQPCQPRRLDINTANGHPYFVASTDQPRTFWAFTHNDLLTPTGITLLDNQDIHGSDVPDYVIVAHKDFIQEAERLADIHRIHDGMNVLVVTQEEVFNEFSSGKPDPMAIRQMMRCLKAKGTRTNTPTPRYLLLFGKGTYDNRDIMGTHQRTVVTYQTPDSFESEGSSYPSDDFFGHLEDYAYNPFENDLSLGIGRLPAKNNTEAAHLVDKIEKYINHSDFQRNDIRGDWRNYVCLLADDADPSCPADSAFASDSEITARKIKEQYPNFNIDRIYADAYIQQSGADGSYYPDAKNALTQRINYGCLLLNYIGHGSSGYIGTERYMEISDIDNYTNTDRATFFITSTCTFGKYDQLEEICGAEAFILADAAGVGIIASARPIHHIQRFNTDLCLQVLNPDNTVGDALRIAKNNTSTAYCINLLGDPALRLSIPKNKVVVTHINGEPVTADHTDSVSVLSRVTVEGEIQNGNGQRCSQFDGVVYPIVYDREVKCHTLANDNDSTEVNFVQQNSILYKGQEKVTEGRFSYTFIVPRDVAYRYDYAKLSHYAHSDIDDATGQYSNIMFGGFNEDIIINEITPTVELFIGDTNFRDGGLTNETPTLFARLSDSVGINAAGSGLGHDITAVVDNNPYSTITLNNFYEPDIEDSRNGSVRYTLGKLDNGPHTLTVKCWNIFNYSSSATISFRVENDKTLMIGQFSSAPNPAHDRTTIRVEHNIPSDITTATIEIYDMCGRRVRTLSPTPTDGCNVLAYNWDFTTDHGTPLPCGIYTARAIITTRNGEQLAQIAKIVRN